MASAKRRFSQRLGYAVGAAILVGGGAVVFLGAANPLRMPGPSNIGHEQLSCESCHRSAPGTLRQQAQANIRWLFGLRAKAVEIGAVPVSSATCTECHVRPDDRHPVYRFFEPRFAEARREMKLERCASCHYEHTGKRVTTEISFCRNCHADLRLARDPLDFSHELLVRTEQWDRCLGCHDFHGNHLHRAPSLVTDTIDPDILREYFNGSPSPYGMEKRHSARR
jgi:hypothetical protein